jgi:UDP-3-O-[3-hydroxymyristoyl] glucosamine N-acyltransferase
MGAALAELEPRCHVGKRCTQAGQVGVVGHIEIADDADITGTAVVSHSVLQAGTFSSGTSLEAYSSWLKSAACMCDARIWRGA